MARQLCAGQQRGETPVRWRRLRLEASARRLSSLSPPGQRRGERLCASAAFESRPPSAARTAAWRGSYALDSDVARRLCAGATSDSRPPSVASHFCRRQYSGAVSSVSVAVWTAARRGSYALDSGAAKQLGAGAASRLEPSIPRLSSLSPPGQRHSHAAMRWRRLSTRGGRPSPPVSVAPLYSGAASSCALDSGAAGQLCACAAFDSRPPSAASRPIAVWAAAWRGSCALRGEGAVCRRLWLEASVHRLSSHRCPGTSMMGRRAAGRRRSWQLRAGQQRARGGSALRWRLAN